MILWLPMRLAERLAGIAENNAMAAIGYVIFVFFLIPGVFLAASSRSTPLPAPVGLSTTQESVVSAVPFGR